jgi:hypothetical protein
MGVKNIMALPAILTSTKNKMQTGRHVSVLSIDKIVQLTTVAYVIKKYCGAALGAANNFRNCKI